MKWFNSYLLLLMLSACIACGQPQQEKVNQNLFAGHYDINKPAKTFEMPKELDEISGITFYPTDNNIVYAEQDEEGKVFKYNLNDGGTTKTKFGNKGDYEDIQILNNYVVMLRSDGTIYTFPFKDLNGTETSNTKEFKQLLPGGEYEGMYADNTSAELYVLCKHCAEKEDKTATVYIFSIDTGGNITPSRKAMIRVKEIAEKAGDAKVSFHPSALVKKQDSNEWFILSSVNKMIVLTTADFKVEAVYKLDPSIYNQPEGIALDAMNNLFISNEKGSTKSATILQIPYSK